MGRIFLVRHGQARDDESRDPDLSDLGLRQAAAVAGRLDQSRITAIWHSPHRRATETARVIASRLDSEPNVCRSLDDLTPVPSAARRGDYPRRMHAWLDSVADAERDEDGVTLSAAWRDLRARAEGKEVVMVTHAFVIARFVADTLDAPQAAWMRLRTANASLTVIGTDGLDSPTLEGFNDTGHLELRGLLPDTPQR